MFKVGDIVRQTKPYCYLNVVGDKPLVIKEVAFSSTLPYVATLIGDSERWIFRREEIELVEQLEFDL